MIVSAPSETWVTVNAIFDEFGGVVLVQGKDRILMDCEQWQKIIAAQPGVHPTGGGLCEHPYSDELIDDTCSICGLPKPATIG